MKTNQKEVLDQQLDLIIEKVETAGSWIKPFKTAIAQGLPENAKTKEIYKGMNVFSLWSQAVGKGYNSNKWLTFKQCKELKGNILKGEKSTPIFFFKPIQIKETDPETKEETKKTIPMLKMYHVFNLDQTSLKEEIQETEEETETAPEKIEEAEAFFNSLNFLELRSVSMQPYYNVNQDFINIPDIKNFIGSGEYYSTLGHEYIHSTGHNSRLDRFKTNESKKDYAYEELIAEIGAIFLMAHLGIKEEAVQDNSSAYLKSWLQALKNDKKYLWKAGAEAQKAFNYLVDHAESNQSQKAS